MNKSFALRHQIHKKNKKWNVIYWSNLLKQFKDNFRFEGFLFKKTLLPLIILHFHFHLNLGLILLHFYFSVNSNFYFSLIFAWK